MTVLNVAEQGIHYLRSCLDLYSENCAFPALYFAALIFLCAKGSERDKRIFLPGGVVLLLTVYNPFSPVILMHFFDVNSEYYRFFWITPAIVLVPYVATNIITQQKDVKQKIAIGALIAVLFVFSGNFLYANGYQKAENIYKMPPELMEVSSIIHENSDTEYTKAFLEYDYNMQMRQYDPKILLTIDREDYLYATSADYTQEMLHDPEHPQYRMLAALIKFDPVNPADFTDALETSNTEFVVVNKTHRMIPYLKQAGLYQVGETKERAVFKYDLKDPYVFELVDYTAVY